ncbi:fungal specific transcription factor domain-containing [Trichoderma arundinaceum]|uniref:Fungal specific transcription factor domain-containing n=1 Tax=Trichoderma arundinaceum TaxID=490622 RepID=A0A395NGF9_TRIAR|nr:fungal specific transcription factor domain-containing [Trichoderma arundinaceum]
MEVYAVKNDDCDGKLPCCDCKLRDRASGCRYADGVVPRQQGRISPYNSVTSSIHSPSSTTSIVATDPDSGKAPSISKLGYVRTGASTVDFLDRIDVSVDEAMNQLGTCRAADSNGDLWERYKPLIKELPPSAYIDSLVDYYFRRINWQYYALDESSFREQLHAWFQLDLRASTVEAFGTLSADTKAFPAVLFEVIATSMLLMMPKTEPNDLNNINGVTSEAMAVKYSESGMAILSLLGKRQISLTTVFADFLRVAFLKYLGQVTEAWHALGEAVKDAQEIGLHRANRDPKPCTDNIATVLKNQWNIQDRRRIWMLLSGWDIHTAVVLGRPAAIDNTIEPTLPVDAPIAGNRSAAPVLPRCVDDVPTPLTRAIWAYRIMDNLRRVQALEKEGSCPKGFSHVDRLDREIRQLDECIPSFFRRHNPDKKFDSLPECYWISSARATLLQLLSFNLIALHRPYIFTRSTSRSRALEACLDMLQAQRDHFDSIDENQYKTFFLFFGTFDAIVLIASIYLFFPDDHLDKVTEAMQHFQWSTERFEAMSSRNHLAKAAVLTLRTLLARLRRAVGWETCYSSTDAFTISPDTPYSHVQAQGMQTELGSSLYYSDTASSCTSTRSSPSWLKQALEQKSRGSQAASFDWSYIEPIFATSDLAYNSLTGSLDAKYYPSSALTSYLPRFSGDFGDNSIWSVLNQETHQEKTQNMYPGSYF